MAEQRTRPGENQRARADRSILPPWHDLHFDGDGPRLKPRVESPPSRRSRARARRRGQRVPADQAAKARAESASQAGNPCTSAASSAPKPTRTMPSPNKAFAGMAAK